ncbi:lipopolysaccharide biosynthesis protein [Arenibaculum pallidiluteum]|uniref:lipopolysaccharide biosynthesis protein n=1 Tax=Arenibaculum pallidiluteum TaxID=2812559 RepID=UPI001A96616B|nr:oligosaccharide flippase family protein [Arenibaculum pallidiluteum]
MSLRRGGGQDEGRRRSSIVARFAAIPALRGVAGIASGTALGQVLTILAYPILMRLFDPADFGHFALFGAIVMTAVVVASGRYELAVVLEREDSGAANVLALALGLVLATSAATGFFLAVAGVPLMRVLEIENLVPLLPLLPLSVLVHAGYQVLSYWPTRRKEFSRLGAAQLSRSFGVSAFQLSMGFAHTGAFGLVLGQILGQGVAMLVLARQVFARGWRDLWKSVDRDGILRAAREHRHFAFYNAPMSLLYSTVVTAPAILLTPFFGPVAAGLYWFAYRLLELPVTMLGDAACRVFYQRAAELHRTGRPIGGAFLRASGGLGLVALGPALVLVLAGPWLFEFAFGAEWREAGSYIRWMAAWWLVRFVSLPSFMLMPVLGLQRRFLALELAVLVPRLGVIPLAAMHSDIYGAVIGYSLVGLLHHLAATLIVLHRVRRHDLQLAAEPPALRPGPPGREPAAAVGAAS